MNKPKIVVLVLSFDDGGIYTKLDNAIRETWASNVPDNIEVLFYQGTNDKNSMRVKDGSVTLINDILLCGEVEKRNNIGKKTILAFDYILKNKQFDYIFRCCSGSYLNLEKLNEFIEDKNREQFYCGVKSSSSKQVKPYASGSGYFISKDLVDLVVKRQNDWNHKNIDDMALGALLFDNGITVANGAFRTDLKSKFKRHLVSKYNNTYHYHFRTNSLYMHKIHYYLEEGNNVKGIRSTLKYLPFIRTKFLTGKYRYKYIPMLQDLDELSDCIYDLINNVQITSILEIGSASGALGRAFCVFSGCQYVDVVDDGRNKNNHYRHKVLYGVLQHEFIGDSQGSLAKEYIKSLNKKYDLIIIDADHHYESVVKDTNNYEEFLNDGGALFFHDYISWDGVKKHLNEFALKENTIEKYVRYSYHYTTGIDVFYKNKSVPPQLKK